MKYLNILILLFLILTFCNKDDEPKFINQNSDEIVKYVINLSGMKIINYTKYINDELIESTSFQESDTTIIRLTTNAENEIIYKRIFRVGNNTLAQSCIDSSFSEFGLYAAKLYYKYENDFLIETTIDWIQFGDYSDSGRVYITRNYINENLTSLSETSPDWPLICSDLFDYYSIINKIDVKDFSNGITGRISKNLIKHVSWNSGCPCGPSSSTSHSDFKYETDEDGYITKMTETYTPCYHTSAEEVTRTIRTTIYEYNAR